MADNVTPASREPVEGADPSGLYATVWRWHFYAGLCVIPLVITLSLSGVIYLFKPQIEGWIDRPYQNLPVTGQRSTANQQIQAALAGQKDAGFLAYQLPERDNQAVIIHLQSGGARSLAYVNPFTLEVVKRVDFNAQFMRQVRAFHGELLAGNVGSVLVELAACWAIVLLVSGIYLWWPRSASGAAGVLYPRLRRGRQVFWRDLHAVTGLWISGMALFLLVTGLPWALVWGSAFKEIRQWNTTPVQQDWSISAAWEPPTVADTPVDLNEPLLDAAMALNIAPPALLAVANNKPGVWTVKSQHQNRPLRTNATLQGDSAELIALERFEDRKLIDRAIGIGVAAHEGQLFGWFNQLLGVITALGLVLMAVSGLVMWLRRKPEKRLGAPPLPSSRRIGQVATVVTLVLAALLPLLAISMVFIFLLERLVLRRMDCTRRWLGLSLE